MPEYFVRIEPTEMQNFYTVTYALLGTKEVFAFSNIPYHFAFGAREKPERGLVVLRAYEAFEALMLLEDPGTEATILCERFEKLSELFS